MISKMQCPATSYEVNEIVNEAWLDQYFGPIPKRYLEKVPCVGRNYRGPEHDQAKIYETVGDAVYEVVARIWQLEYQLTDANFSVLKSNLVQGCMFSITDLCNRLRPVYGQNPPYKLMGPCADYLETLIGAIFTYLTEYGIGSPIGLIERWLRHLLRVEEILGYGILYNFPCWGDFNHYRAVSPRLCFYTDGFYECYE